MNNKKLLQIIVICVVAVWIFCITLTIGVFTVRKQKDNSTSLAPLATGESYSLPPSEQPTFESTTSAPAPEPTPSDNVSSESSALQQSSEPSVSQQPTEQTETTEAKPNIPTAKSDIIQTYIQAVNKLKSESNFTLVKSENLSVSIVEMTPASAMNMANKMIQSNSQEAPVTYRFSNGFDSASGMSPTNVIAPLGKTAALNESIVTNATATPNSDGSFTIKLSLGSEVQTLNSPAPNYSTSMQVIELENLGLPSNAKFDSLNITYNASTIEANISSDGKITHMKHFLNVSNAEGSGSMVFPITAKLNGNFTTDYQISY